MASNISHLRVTFAAAPPFAQAQYHSGKVYLAGIFSMVLQALADFVPFSYDLVHNPQVSFGVRLANGTYTGIIGLLQSGEFDLAATSVVLQYDRSLVATYAPILYTTYCGLIAVAGQPSVNAFSYIYVFNWEVWAVLLASIPLVSAALAFVEKRRPRNGGSFAWETYENTWDILRSFCYEGHTAETNSDAGRLLFAVWWLTVLVLTNGFAGQLKASMAIKIQPPRFRSTDDVTLQPAIRPLIWKDTVYEAYVRTSTKPSLQQLARQVHRHEGFVSVAEMHSETAMEQLYNGRAVIISDRHVTMYMLANQCRLTGGRLYVAPELLFTRFVSVAHAKTMAPPLARRIHAKVAAMSESGLNLKWYNDAMREWHRCRAMQEASASQVGGLSFEVLHFDDMAAVFALWSIMTALALIIFLVEMCLHGADKRHP